MTTTPSSAARVRAAAPADLDFLLALAPRLVASLPPWRDREPALHGYADLFRAALLDPASLPEETGALVAEDDAGTPLGFVLLYALPDDGSVFVKDLAVTADAEGRGVGALLLAAAEGWARERGLSQVGLKVNAGNARARALYARAGFAEDHLMLVKPLG